MKMKHIVFFSAMMTIVSACFAQWNVKTVDNGFDEKHFEASAPSFDNNAQLEMVELKNRVILAVETPDIWYKNNYNDVILTYKIKGENKEYKIRGMASKGTHILMLTTASGGIDNIGDLMQGDFLTDFKNATAMKLQITYGASYEYETYVFRMNGSTTAYNKIASQLKPEQPKQETNPKSTNTNLSNNKKDEDETAYDIVEQEPEFPGGIDAMYQFIQNNLQYPQLAIENNISGRVFVSFVVEKDGSLSNVKCIRDIGGGCGAEAVRIVNARPQWIPGKQRDKIVRARYTLPVIFEIK